MIIGKIPELSVPATWADAAGDVDVATAEDLLAALLAPAHPARRLALTATGFADRLRIALAGDAGSAVVAFPDGMSVHLAALLVAEVLGGARVNHVPLVGPVHEVNSTSDKEAWHTDASPWLVPNRWTLLGSVSCAPRWAQAPTCVLPFTRALADWPERAHHLRVLTSHQANWRQTFDGAGENLVPAIVPDAVHRWIRLAVPAEFADDGPVGAAYRSFDAWLASVPSWYEAVVRPGSLLIIDNHRVLHHGPAVEDPDERVVLRVKPGGVPDLP